MQRAVVLGLLVAALSMAAPRVRLGGVVVGGSYSSGPGWWGPRWWGPGWGYYDPYWYGPWFHSGYYGGFTQGAGMGQVRLNSAAPDAVVLLDGAYAGEARKLKSIWLQPGVYKLEIRHRDLAFERRIYVLSGKTLELRPEMKPIRNEESR